MKKYYECMALDAIEIDADYRESIDALDQAYRELRGIGVMDDFVLEESDFFVNNGVLFSLGVVR